MDDRTQRRLSELREALFEAISSSEAVHEVWTALQEEGYSLYLLLESSELRTAEVRSADPERIGEAAREPVFQINGEDLSFLRSVGIDPTRRPPRGKSRE
ncbi:MAG: hypothetical protein K8J08_14140 [Thermoanaerobaculia bacterium]|nr:hypothetical protein [Thermoanaerobaculia bacterium]